MQSTIDPLMSFILGFFVIANLTTQIIELIFQIILVPRFGLIINSVSFFGLFFIKQNGKWKVGFERLSCLCQCHIVNDISKPISEDSEKKEKQASYLVKLSVLLVSILVTFIFSNHFLKLFYGETLSLLNIFVLSFAIGMVFHSIIHIGIYVYTYHVIMKRMGGYINSIIKKIRQGYSFEDLNLKAVENLPYKNVTKTERLLYYNFYVYYLLVIGRIDELQKISHEITDLLEDSEFIVQQTGLYYWLIYYYSKYEINSEMADKFLERVWPYLSKDSDANAKRVLAYYYKVKGDTEKARKCLNEGLSCVESFACGAERDLERRLLEELADELRKIDCG